MVILRISKFAQATSRRIAIDIPEAIGQKSITQWENVSQREKEALAFTAYRSCSLTSAQIQSLLNLSSL